MTGDFERQLAVALREQTPDPPTTMTAELVWGRTRRGHRQWLAAAASIVCVLGLALGLGFALRGSSNRPAANRLAAIENVVWKDTRSYGTVVFHDGTIRLFDGCSGGLSALRVVSGRLIEGRQLSSDGTCSGIPIMTAAMRRAEQRLQHFYAVIHGPATWIRNGNELMLTRSGKGSITLRTDGRPAPEVVGTACRLVMFRPASSDFSYSGPGRLFVSSSGLFRASGTCPPVAGRAAVGAATIRLFPKKTRAYSCPVPATGSELAQAANSTVNAVLRGRVAYEIRGDELMLDGGRRGFLVYRAVAR
jgi:hypothetical protein